MIKEVMLKVASRRSLLSGVAMLAVGLGVAGCSTAQIQSAEATWASIVGEIQSAVATAATYVPTIESIAATAASLFGPAYTAIVQVGSAAFNQIVSTLINVVGALTPPAVASLRRRLATSARGAPIQVGTTPAGVPVLGFKVG